MGFGREADEVEGERDGSSSKALGISTLPVGRRPGKSCTAGDIFRTGAESFAALGWG